MEIERIGEAGWLRRDEERTNQLPFGAVRYWLKRPNGTPAVTILVTHEGLRIASDGAHTFSTEQSGDALMRVIILAQRQYHERLEHGLTPHDADQDRQFEAWLKEI